MAKKPTPTPTPKGAPEPKQVEAFLNKLSTWGRELPEAERALLSHVLTSSTGLLTRPKFNGDGFWAQWAQRQY